ncbi:hypothetical protein [Staphylococcus gallinarum]|nr:hypothetical protein [Staphylococcus gallinarum]MBU7218583.1 hypothetical protein [Staphylococcus gallinarum]MCD8794318.1 hypothetical protein [Staphylococcus gallinarum]PTK88147.1 hypothetical protein BUZ03_13820 [Staphylococcus gallinarum]RIO82364.1 hypothetical protein BUZ10_12570 [Staphylococcus gallinarum]
MEYNHNETLETIRSWINNCDTKVSFALTFEVFLLGFIFSNDNLKNLTEIKKEINLYSIILLVSFLITMMFLLFALVHFYKTLKANTNFEGNYPNMKSVLYYGSISDGDFNHFRQNVNNLDIYKLNQDYLMQIHINSVICQKKFDNYNKGLKYLFISLIPLVIYFVISIFK